jgi:hypothetical protein
MSGARIQLVLETGLAVRYARVLTPAWRTAMCLGA